MRRRLSQISAPMTSEPSAVLPRERLGVAQCQGHDDVADLLARYDQSPFAIRRA